MSVTPEAFTARVKAVLETLPTTQVTVLRPLALHLDLDGRKATLDLTAACARAQREPALLEEIIAHAAQALPEAVQTDRLVPDRVLPVLRTLEDVARLTQGRGDAARPVTRPFLGPLVWTLVHDGTHSVRVCTRLDADRLGLSDDGVWRQARQNLARVPHTLHGDGDLVQVVAGGTYDASCLWHPGVLESLPEGTLAVVPARGVFLAVPRPSSASRHELHSLAEEVFRTRQHRLCLDRFVLQKGAFRCAG